MNAGSEIVASQDFSNGSFSVEIHHPVMASAAQPGRFVNSVSERNGYHFPLISTDFDMIKECPYGWTGKSLIFP